MMCMNVIASGTPSWHWCRASALEGSDLQIKSAGMRHCSPLMQASRTTPTQFGLQNGSTQWSMALKPDWSQMSNGVVRASLASMIISRGPLSGPES